MLGADGQYTHLRRSRNGKSFSVQEHLMELAGGFVNGSGKPRELHLCTAHAMCDAAVAPTEVVETVELETQESANATV